MLRTSHLLGETMKKLFVLVTFLLLPFTSNADNFLYVLSAKAKIMSEPSFSSITIDRISKGQKVESIAKNNHWFKVKYKNKIGWLSRLAVSSTHPIKRVSLLAKNNEQLKNESRRRASTVSTTAAIRGLRGIGQHRASDKNKVDYETLAKIENMQINADDIATFMSSRPSR